MDYEIREKHRRVIDPGTGVTREIHVEDRLARVQTPVNLHKARAIRINKTWFVRASRPAELDSRWRAAG